MRQFLRKEYEAVIELHPVDRLFQRLESVGPYPLPGVVPIPTRIAGLAFFPGGAGLWGVESGKPLPPMPVGGVMVLGHNFDSVSNYTKSLQRGCENLRGQTWRNTLDIVDRAGIPRQCCFFTNAYMGLIDGPKAAGVFPGSRDSAFVARCREFLSEQIAAQQPGIILVLGPHARKVLAPLSPELEPEWSRLKTFSALDQRDLALVYPVRFQGVPHAVAAVALIHPSLRPPNVQRRHYHSLKGDAAEIELITEAIRKSRVFEGGGCGQSPDLQKGEASR